MINNNNTKPVSQGCLIGQTIPIESFAGQDGVTYVTMFLNIHLETNRQEMFVLQINKWWELMIPQTFLSFRCGITFPAVLWFWEIK